MSWSLHVTKEKTKSWWGENDKVAKESVSFECLVICEALENSLNII